MRIASKSKHSLANLPPTAEWDFRNIPDKEIDAAVEYEYFREDQDVCTRVVEWLSGPFRRWEILKLSDQEKGLRLQSHFARVDQGLPLVPVEVEWLEHSFASLQEAYLSASSFHDLPFDVQVVMMDSFPFWETALIDWVAHFPAPWLQIPKEHRFAAEKTAQVVPFSSSRSEDLRISRAQEEQQSAKHYSVRIDWESQPSHIVAAFKKWLKTAKPKNLKPTQTRGRSNRKGLLKSLSALRLHRAVGFENAQTVLWDALKGRAKHPLLPIYDDEKHWDRVRKGAALFLKKRKALFTVKTDQELESDLSGLLDH